MNSRATDHDLLFGSIALELGLIDADRLASACRIWSKTPNQTLREIFVDQGWLPPADREAVDYLLEMKLAAGRKHGVVEDKAPPSPSLFASMSDVSEMKRVLDPWGSDLEPDCGSRRDVDADPDSTPNSPTPTPRANPGVNINARSHSGPSTDDFAPLPFPGLANSDRSWEEPPLEHRERYERIRLHATGGLGRVWVAKDRELGRRVAIKELRPDKSDNAEVRSRFLGEARIASQLEHPGIVPVYELAKPDDGRTPYYAMRFIQGRTLSEKARDYHKRRASGEARAIDLAELLNAFVATCQTMAYAHSRGVIHRDLKGQNIVAGPFGEVLVLDWGLAKLIKPPATPSPSASASASAPQTEGSSDWIGEKPPPVAANFGEDEDDDPAATVHGQVMGTPAFMSPEQAAGRHEALDARSDVYSLGAILYEILTGQPPYQDERPSRILERVLHEEPKRPSLIVAEVPLALEAICLKAMAREPSERYGDALALAREVQCWLADEPVRAYPESSLARLSRWARRHRGAAASVALVLITGLLGVTAVALLLSHSNALMNNQRQTAHQDLDQAMRAIDQLGRAGDSWLRNRSSLQRLQKEWLKELLVFYEEYFERHNVEPSMRWELADAYRRVARITEAVGYQKDAMDIYRRALALYEQCDQNQPNAPNNLYARADILMRLGVLQLEVSGELENASRSLTESLDLWNRLRRREPENASYRHGLAQCQSRCGQVQMADLNVDMAQDLCGQALAAYRQLLKDDPGNQEYKREYVEALLDQSMQLADLESGARSRDLVNEALAICLELKAGAPDSDETNALLARVKLETSTLSLVRGDVKTTARETLDALEIRKTLAEAHPQALRHRRNLAHALVLAGVRILHWGQGREAEKLLDEAARIGEELQAAHPENVQVRSQLSQTYFFLAQVAEVLGPAERIRHYLERSLLIQDALVEENPRIPSLQSQRNRARAHMARFLHSEADAIEEIKHTVEEQRLLVRNRPESSQFRRDFIYIACLCASALRDRNDFRAAEEYIRAALEVHEELAYLRPLDHYNHACMLSLLSELAMRGPLFFADDMMEIREREMDQALEALRSAVEKGFNIISALETDPDLDAIRSHPEFQIILSEAQARLRLTPAPPPSAAAAPSRTSG